VLYFTVTIKLHLKQRSKFPIQIKKSSLRSKFHKHCRVFRIIRY